MRLSDLFKSPRDFAGRSALMKLVQRRDKKGLQQVGEPSLLLIFDTSKQRTWLVSDGLNLYCVLDWTREDSPRIKWSLDRRDIVKNGVISIDVSTSDYSERVGYVRINHTKPRFYSKRLFTDQQIDEAIKDFLAKSFGAKRA